MRADELKKVLEGPIAFIPTYFSQSGDQDLDSVARTVDRAIDNGMKILLLTEGDSNYALQSEDEIRRVMATVVERAAGRAVVIAGTAHQWWREQIVDFARYAESVGADAVMVLRPQQASGDGAATEEAVFELYREASEALECAVVLNGRFSMRLLKRLAGLPGVGAAKEDAGDAWCHDALWTVGRHLPIFNGGQKWRFLYGMLFGMPAFMTLFGLWHPSVTHRFWDLVQRRDLFGAAEVVDRFDNPYFEFAIGHARGYHAVQQAAMEVFGCGPRWLRQPHVSLDDGELEELRSVFEGMGLPD